ncbi:hypothetical protein PsalBI1_04459 (plasmid) [Piscirickettsia salmonis]|nr:hypothetical protein PsalSR1_04507 [Piscirickettsia salmonis]QGP61817.1 hypothetical protein PsalBI1_04459 [Piscirickettsia salmonis]
MRIITKPTTAKCNIQTYIGTVAKNLDLSMV